MSAELHPDTEKYYQRVKRRLQEIGKWNLVLEKWSRRTREGEPITITGEQAVKTAVSHILDRCDYAETDPEVLDWQAIAELMPDYENPEDYLEGLTASQLVPPPSPSEEAFYTYVEQEIRQLIDKLFSLPPEKRKPLIDEIIQKSGALEKLIREAEEARKLKKRVEEYNRKIKTLEEQLEALRRKVASLIVSPPPPAPPPQPKPEWETRLEKYRADYFSKAHTWIQLFIPRDKQRAVEEEARRLWREYETDIAEACRAGRYQLAEQRLRDAEQDLAKQIVMLMPRNKASALAYFQEQGILPIKEVQALAKTQPPEALPPGYEATPYALRERGRPVPAVAYWASQPIPVIADSPNPWERAFGLPVLRKMGMTVELHLQTYGALVKMSEMAKVSPPASNIMTTTELKTIIDTLKNKLSSTWAIEWLDKLLDELETG
jgi:polyhydroxyalkanoate synthesis regulator phasin